MSYAEDVSTILKNTKTDDDMKKYQNHRPVQQQQKAPIEKVVKPKDDIKTVIFYNTKENNYKNENSDYKLNYAQPDKEAYRVKRNKVLLQKLDGSSVSKSASTEYTEHFVKEK